MKIFILIYMTLSLYGASTNKDFTLKDGKGIILNNSTNTYSTKLLSSDNLNDNITLTLPQTPPQNNQILTVNSNGELSWTDKEAKSDNTSVFLGKNSGINNSNSDSMNTGIGVETLKANTDGHENTANGYQSLYNNIDGSYNTALGKSSLYYNNSGNYNTAIGFKAGLVTSSHSDNSGGNKNIFIGYTTKPKNSDDTNEIVIGSEAVGEGNNSVVLGNDDINKTILKGHIGIGKTDPTSNLDIFYDSKTDYGKMLTRYELSANPNEDTNTYYLANGTYLSTPQDNDKYTRGLVGSSIKIDKQGNGRVYVGTTLQSLYYHSAGQGDYVGSIDAQSNISGSSNIGYLTGIDSQNYISDDATVSNLISISSYISTSSSQTLTTAKGLWVRKPAGSGEISHLYGIYIEDMAGRATTDNYSIYSDGGVSYFKDSIGIGTKNPTRKLDINGVMHLTPVSEPSSPTEGDLYMDKDTHKLRVYDGTDWQDCW